MTAVPLPDGILRTNNNDNNTKQRYAQSGMQKSRSAEQARKEATESTGISAQQDTPSSSFPLGSNPFASSLPGIGGQQGLQGRSPVSAGVPSGMASGAVPMSLLAQQLGASRGYADVAQLDAAMLLRRQEDQLLASRLLLQQQQRERLLGAGMSNALLGSHLLGNPSSLETAVRLAGLEQPPTTASAASLLAAQRTLPTNNDVPSGAAGIAAMPGIPGVSDLSPSLVANHRARLEAGASNTATAASADPKSAEDDSAADDKDAENKEEEEEEEEDPNNPRATLTENFPKKLYRIIEEAENDGKGDIISFFPHGQAFAIHKPREFVADIMPKYFTTSRMSSFQRQLNLYGFRRITEGRDKGGYFHECFMKGKKSLCKKIKRKKANTKMPPHLLGPHNPLSASSALEQEVLMRQALMRSRLLHEATLGTALGLGQPVAATLASSGLLAAGPAAGLGNLNQTFATSLAQQQQQSRQAEIMRQQLQQLHEQRLRGYGPRQG